MRHHFGYTARKSALTRREWLQKKAKVSSGLKRLPLSRSLRSAKLLSRHLRKSPAFSLPGGNWRHRNLSLRKYIHTSFLSSPGSYHNMQALRLIPTRRTLKWSTVGTSPGIVSTPKSRGEFRLRNPSREKLGNSPRRRSAPDRTASSPFMATPET